MSDQTAMAQRGLMPITVQNITLTLNERMLIDDLSCIIKSDGMSVIMGAEWCWENYLDPTNLRRVKTRFGSDISKWS